MSNRLRLQLIQHRLRRKQDRPIGNPADSVGEGEEIPLPLYLQDLCLLRVINDLDAYPVDLLASLPRWLRYRLLSSLPDIDLCRLDSTPVAEGIELDELWEPRLKELTSRYPRGYVGSGTVRRLVSLRLGYVQDAEGGVDLQGQFDLSVQANSTSSRRRFRVSARHNPTITLLGNPAALKKELDLAFDDLNSETELASARRRYLSKLMSINISEVDIDMDRFTSINGMKLLQNLVSSQSASSITNQNSNIVWQKQVTALKLITLADYHAEYRSPFHPDYDTRTILSLFPSRWVTFKVKADAPKMLSFLVDYCPQPASVNFHVNSLAQRIRQAFHNGKFAQDNGYKLSSGSKTCMTTMNRLLREVEILKLGCDDYSNTGVVISMIEAAMVEGSECKLRCLYCTLPDVYSDLVKPLSSVFSLPNFRYLILNLGAFYMPSLSKLLVAFLTAPCPHEQRLTIEVEKMVQTPDNLDVADLATYDMGGVTVPESAIEHKVLRPSRSGPAVLHLLLQLPTIRLNEIHIHSIRHLHLCSLHPDLKVKKLYVDLKEAARSQDTLTPEESYVRLMTMPTVQEISIAGNWVPNKNVKLGFMNGFRRRTTRKLPLRQLSMQSSTKVQDQDYVLIWEVIFCLPRLEQMALIISSTFTNVKSIHHCWLQSTRRKSQLKSVCVNFKVSEEDKGLLSQMAHEYSSQ